MSRDIGRLFDEISGSYDQDHRRNIACFEELYGAVLGHIPVERGEVRVLDLGSGTGILTAMVGKAFPESKVTSVDISQEMMNVAKTRLADEPDGRFEFLLMDYVEEPLPGKYDAVVSALSLHHIEDEAKRRVFRVVYDSLEEGGVFVNADQFHLGGPHHEAGHHKHHGGSGAGDIHHPKTHESSLDQHLEWLREAGFVGVESTYRNDRFAVFAGRKETV